MHKIRSLLSNRDLHPEKVPNFGQIPTSLEQRLPDQENVQEVNTTRAGDKEAVLRVHKPQEEVVDPINNGQPSLQRDTPRRDKHSLEADHLVVTNLGNQAEHLVEDQRSPVERDHPAIPLNTKTSNGIHLSQIPPGDTK